MRNGSIARRNPWEPLTDASESLFSPIDQIALAWPTPYGVSGNHGPDGNEFSTAVRQWATPVGQPANGTPEAFLERKRQAVANGTQMGICLSDLNLQVQTWPSPRSEDSESRGNHPGATDSLTGATALWTTPQAHDTHKRSEGQTSGKLDNVAGNRCLATDASLWARPQGAGGGSVSRGGDRIDEPLLAGQANAWPTPRTTDVNEGRGAVQINGTYYRPSKELEAGELVGQANLADVTKQWATPAGRDYRSPNGESYQDRSDSTKGEQLVNQVEHQFLPQDQRQTGDASRKCSTRRLNPAFVCWLMGVPWFWTRAEPISSAAAEMAAYRSLLQSHLSSLCGGQGSQIEQPATAGRHNTPEPT